MGVDGVCMKLSHSWLQTGTVSAEHTAGTQLVTAGASKTSAMSVNFLELAQYTCFCRIQVMNLALFLPPSSLNSRACSQQDASPWGIPCSARMLPGQTADTEGAGGATDVPAAQEPAAGKQQHCYMAIREIHCWKGTFSWQLLPLVPELLECDGTLLEHVLGWLYNNWRGLDLLGVETGKAYAGESTAAQTFLTHL